MKYAVVGPRGRVFKILDKNTPQSIEISDEIATQIENTKDALLINGIVTSHLLEREAGFNLKWNENNKAWDRIPIVKPVPKSVTATQIRLWLIKNNISMDMVYSAIQAIPDPKVKEEISVLWEYAPYIERNHPMLLPLASSLGLSETNVDLAFMEASTF